MQQDIRKGDLVEIVAGRDKGKQGEVIRVLPEDGRLLVRNVNLVMRYTRPTRKHPDGGMIATEDPLHVINVRVVPRHAAPEGPRL
jgi:large subunit ribosomal protein L24